MEMVKIEEKGQRYVCTWRNAMQALTADTAFQVHAKEEGVQFIFVRKENRKMKLWPCAKAEFDSDHWSEKEIEGLLDGTRIHAFHRIHDAKKHIPPMKRCFEADHDIVIGVCVDRTEWRYTLEEQLVMIERGEEVPVTEEVQVQTIGTPPDTSDPLWASKYLKQTIHEEKDPIAAVGMIDATSLFKRPNDVDTAIVFDLLLDMMQEDQRFARGLQNNWPDQPRILRIADHYASQQRDFTMHFIREYYHLSKEKRSDTDVMMQFLKSDRITSISASFGEGQESAFLDTVDMDRYMTQDYFWLCVRSAIVYALEVDAILVVRITVSEECDEMYGFVISEGDILSVPKAVLASQFRNDPSEPELAGRERFCEFPYFRRSGRVS